MESVNYRIFEDLSAISDDISQGLLYTHTRINDNTKKVLESSSFLYGLIELLSEKGMIKGILVVFGVLVHKSETALSEFPQQAFCNLLLSLVQFLDRDHSLLTEQFDQAIEK